MNREYTIELAKGTFSEASPEKTLGILLASGYRGSDSQSYSRGYSVHLP